MKVMIADGALTTCNNRKQMAFTIYISFIPILVVLAKDLGGSVFFHLVKRESLWAVYMKVH